MYDNSLTPLNKNDKSIYIDKVQDLMGLILLFLQTLPRWIT